MIARGLTTLFRTAGVKGQARNLGKAFSERTHGNLADSDRIFTNLYNDTSPWVDDAMRRVSSPLVLTLGRLASDQGHFGQWA